MVGILFKHVELEEFMSHHLEVLGHLTAEQFLTEYWQKKPLLVRNAIPEVVHLLEPDDIKTLALEENVTARLIQQHGKQHHQWSVKCSPLSAKDFKSLPPYWTLLVQALDHYSFEIADLWKKFHFLPQWRRDDVMVSYAPKGGSVGKHFDFYDVFLVQAYGQRRWQLGQMCDEYTEFLPNQPLKLLPNMDIYFDEILNPGDLLYVPPTLSHYGVAENDCLTLSFGFRMPNLANMIDRTSDLFADQSILKNPLVDITRTTKQPIGQISNSELSYLKQQLIEKLIQGDEIHQSLMALISEPKYPDHLPEAEEISLEELEEYAQHGYMIRVEPASRLLYRQLTDDQFEFWANGELLCIDSLSSLCFKALADGESLELNAHCLIDSPIMQDLLDAIHQSILIVFDPTDDEAHE